MTRPAPSMKALRIANWPHRPATPDRDRVAAFDVAILRGHVPRRKYVGQEENLFVAERFRNFHRTDVGERHADVLGLAAGISAEQMRITEKTGRGVAPQRGRHFCVLIGTLADREEPACAEKTLAARHCERDDYAVADGAILDVAADRNDLAHETRDREYRRIPSTE